MIGKRVGAVIVQCAQCPQIRRVDAELLAEMLPQKLYPFVSIERAARSFARSRGGGRPPGGAATVDEGALAGGE